MLLGGDGKKVFVVVVVGIVVCIAVVLHTYT